jgi:hypothetical protein
MTGPVGLGMMFRSTTALVTAGLLAGACQGASVGTADLDIRVAPLAYADLSCARFGRTDDTPAAATLSRVARGHDAYIEFRLRPSATLPGGHLYVAFGELDNGGEPVTRHLIGLQSAMTPVGPYLGAMVPLPGRLAPSFLDCRWPAISVYRVSLDKADYARLLGRVNSVLDDPPRWHMFDFNCNHFSAMLGEEAGLKSPGARPLTSRAYLDALIRINGV